MNRTLRRLENARTLSTGFFGYILPSAIPTRSRWVDRTCIRAYRLLCTNLYIIQARSRITFFLSDTFNLSQSLLKNYLTLLIPIIVNIRERLLLYDRIISNIFIYGLEGCVISEAFSVYI